MKVLHVSPSFYPAHYYGGPTQSVYALCRALSTQGCDVMVLTSNANGPKVVDVPVNSEIAMEDQVRTIYCGRLFKPDIAPSMVQFLPRAMRWADLVHITGVFSVSSLLALSAASSANRPVVWSPRGSLQSFCLQRHNLFKRAWLSACRLAQPKTMALHLTSEEERADTAKIFPEIPAHVISNGVDLPKDLVKSERKGPLRVVFLGRVHPIKGIENLMQAAAASPNISLTIAGGGATDYLKSLVGLAADLNIADRTRFVGEVVGAEKERLFAESDVLVLPSYSENFGLVIAEALAHWLPVIASHGTPWRQVESAGCGLYVANDPESLAAALARIDSMPLHEMGQRGRALVEAQYTWQPRAAQMLRLYQDLLDGSTAAVPYRNRRLQPGV